jgi:hypothetical protein
MLEQLIWIVGSLSCSYLALEIIGLVTRARRADRAAHGPLPIFDPGTITVEYEPPTYGRRCTDRC